MTIRLRPWLMRRLNIKTSLRSGVYWLAFSCYSGLIISYKIRFCDRIYHHPASKIPSWQFLNNGDNSREKLCHNDEDVKNADKKPR